MPTDPDQRLIDAIHADRLADLDHPDAIATCAAIASRMHTEVDDAIDRLAGAGIVVARPALGARMQRHSARFDVADAATARRAADVLGAAGYEIWEAMDGAPGRVHARFRNVVTMARTSDVTISLRLRWPRRPSRIPAALLPNQADFAAVDLPAALWPLYFVIRPLRLVAERAGVRRPAPALLGPFLSTPSDLIPALLELADVTSEDTVADLGCGDARILVEAAVRTGCRSIGVETDPDLVLPQLTEHAGPLIEAATLYLQSHIERLAAEGYRVETVIADAPQPSVLLQRPCCRKRAAAATYVVVTRAEALQVGELESGYRLRTFARDRDPAR